MEKGINLVAFVKISCLVAALPSLVSAQFSIKNRLDYTDWYDYDRRIVENWTDVAWQKNNLQIGGRYEINYPPDPFIFPQDSLLKQFDFTFAYAEYEMNNWNLRAGNFYSMFGRGLTLRTYEDRNLRTDNNILGGAVSYTGDALTVKTIAGKMRDKYIRRKDYIYGVDAEATPLDAVQIGVSFLYQDTPGGDLSRMSAVRANWFWDWGDLYGEVVKPGWSDKLSHYWGFTGIVGDFTFTSEYKSYDQMSFKNSYGMEYNAAPALTREHTFTMLNRHPHALNMDDEKGWQIEVAWTPSPAWDMTANNSKTLSHSGQRIYEEYYLESHNYFFNDKLETRLAAAWNFDFSTNTENITTIIDPQYEIGGRDLLHLSWQHQHTKNVFDLSEYDTELLQIEYSRSPFGSIALVGEYTNKYQLNNVIMNRHTWLYAQLTLNFWRNQELMLLYGSRQAGFVCVGGICRYEPEFRGLEVRLVNRF